MALFFIVGIRTKAQTFFDVSFSGPEFLDSLGKPYAFPFTGGLTAPQFEVFDINDDGREDLLVFDRKGSKYLPFIRIGATGSMTFTYAPQYARYFPAADFWIKVRDIDRDGRNDLFVGERNGMSIHMNAKQASDTTPVFVLKTDLLTDTLDIDPGIGPDSVLKVNIYNDPNNLPLVEDIDGDGDLDLLCLDIVGTYFVYYKNVQVEAGLPKDSVACKRVDQCWGSFGISFSANTADLAIKCPYARTYGQRFHFNSATSGIDMDGDGDMEMIHGDISYNNLALFTNGRKDFNWPIDTMISADTSFPSNTRKFYACRFPAAFFMDVDEDGLRDMICAPNTPDESKDLRHCWYYRNTGTAKVPSFQFVTDRFLWENTLDMGSGAAPAFIDADGDGDQDLIVGTAGDFEINQLDSDALYWYENTGTDSNPKFKLKDTDWQGIRAQGWRYIRPAFGDVDGDNKPDLLIGVLKGELKYFKNTSMGSANNRFTLVDAQFEGIDVGDFSSPSMGDVNGDGKPDLIVGRRKGFIAYYQRNQNTSSPFFDFITDTLAGIIVSDSFFNGTNYQYRSEGYAAPALGDINGDGKIDLVVGNKLGQVRIYTSVSDNLFGKMTVNKSGIRAPFEKDNAFYSFGIRTIPAIYSAGTITQPDVYVGNPRGGIHYLKNSYTGTGIKSDIISTTPNWRAFPVPANDLLTIQSPPERTTTSFMLYNSVGQLMHTWTWAPAQVQETVDVSSYPPGMYFLVRKDKEQSTGLKIILE